jgi:drug/metabolite transporter (DMT)-like permease
MQSTADNSYSPIHSRPAAWAFVLAFAAIYLSYGCNYLFIKEAVRTLPPLLFAGAHIALGGCLLFLYLLLRRRPLGLAWPKVGWAAAGGLIVFVCGTGLVTTAETPTPGRSGMPSGMTAILRATVPLWIAGLEWLRPRGERLAGASWLGLLVAVAGVLILMLPQLEDPGSLWRHPGPLLVLGSALAWALGSILLRHRRPSPSHLLSAAYPMVIGGSGLLLLGLAVGETGDLRPQEFTPAAWRGVFGLLFSHSLIAFVALTWLLAHVSAAVANTHEYVSPVIALVAGWLLLGETITAGMIGGVALVLAGVLLTLTSATR